MVALRGYLAALLSLLACLCAVLSPAHGKQSAATATIGPATIAALKPIWTATLKGGVHKGATPVLDGQSIFLPDAGGRLYRIDAATGEILSEFDLAKLLDSPGATGAKSVAVTATSLVFGLRNGPIVVAIDKATGALLWKTTVDDFHGAVITQTPIVVDGRVYIGVSGLGEEVAATTPPYQCCGFRGSVLALDAATGKILWKRYTVPPGFAGGSVWSSAPLFDQKRHSLYVTTGNAFRAPPDVQSCIEAHLGDRQGLVACYPKDVWYDSILALNPDDGTIKWGFRAENADIFTGACIVRIGGYCGGGEDFDFGNGALQWRKNGRDFVGAGQKSGIFWALDAETGKLAWNRRLGPGGPNGGMEYGSAVDGTRVYAAEGNTKQVAHDPGAYTLPSGQTIKYGSYAALDTSTGKILWQVADPAGIKHPGNDQPCTPTGPRENCVGAFTKGAVSVFNGVLYGCSLAPTGALYGLDAATGKFLWTFEAGMSCDTKPVVSDHALYWVVGKTVYAFGLTGPSAPAVAATPAIAAAGKLSREGVYRADQAERGKAIYMQSCAAGCHNANLSGGGPVPGLAGPEFVGRWAGLSIGELFARMRTTMPKNQPGSLSDDAYSAITAYILSANDFPAGTEPLPDRRDVLDKIAIPPN
jgi:polyvinyl alcohol dehydrogenase (cytochrome)